MTTKSTSRTKAATLSVADGATSVLALIPALAAKAVGIIEAGLSLLKKAVTAIDAAALTIEAKLEEAEAFLNDVASNR